MRIDRRLKFPRIHLAHTAISQCNLAFVFVQLRHDVWREPFYFSGRRGFGNIIRTYKSRGVARWIHHRPTKGLVIRHKPPAAKRFEARVFRVAGETHDGVRQELIASMTNGVAEPLDVHLP